MMVKMCYTLSQVARFVNLPYHTVYAMVIAKRLCVSRSIEGSQVKLYVSHSDLKRFLLTVDWLLAPTVDPEHPFADIVTHLRARYIQRSAIAVQLGYSEGYVKTWGIQKFPAPCVRGGWYKRSSVLRWLKRYRPHDYARINGIFK